MTPLCNSLGVLCKSQGSEQEVEDELGVRQLWDASSLLREDAAHLRHAVLMSEAQPAVHGMLGIQFSSRIHEPGVSVFCWKGHCMPEAPQAHAWCCLLKPWLFQIAWGRLQPFPARAESRCQHFSCRAQAEHAVPQLKLIFFFFFFPSDHTSELIPTSPFLTPNGSKKCSNDQKLQ